MFLVILGYYEVLNTFNKSNKEFAIELINPLKSS